MLILEEGRWGTYSTKASIERVKGTLNTTNKKRDRMNTYDTMQDQKYVSAPKSPELQSDPKVVYGTIRVKKLSKFLTPLKWLFGINSHHWT